MEATGRAFPFRTGGKPVSSPEIARGGDRAMRLSRSEAVSGAAGVIVLIATVATAAALPAPAAAQLPTADHPPGLDLPVLEDTLPNGLRVLALRRPGAPTVSFVLRFDVGSAHEALGETGIAHFLEHLLFKGTTTIGTRSLRRERALFRSMDAIHDTLLAARADGADPAEETRLRRRIRALEEEARAYVVPAELDRILTEAGARRLNATTGTDGTQYYVQLPANRAELWFVLEADRLANPVFREFYAERDVVAEERRQQIESSPGGRLAEEFYAAAYRVHPYGVPVIGHMSDIQAHTREQVAAFHRRHYHPGNAVVAVVGDIDPARIHAWARRYFGPIASGDPPPPVRAVEPPQRGERRVEVVFDAAPEVMLGWHVPAGADPESPAVAVLAEVLAGGRSSRLYRRLVMDDDLAHNIRFDLGPGYRYPRMLAVMAQPLTGRSTAEIEAVIDEEVRRLALEPPTEHELQRVRNQLEAAEVHRLGSSLGLAMQLAESVAHHGDWRETFRHAQRLSAVAPADVQRAAARYLTRENRTVAVLVRPESGVRAASDADRPGGSR
jgi:predicted Zn-dependent peptidase